MDNQFEYGSKQKQIIHQLIEAIFSGEALERFTSAHFQQVYEKFEPDMTMGHKTQLLIEHCAQQGQLGRLMSQIQQDEPQAYQNFVRRFQQSASKEGDSTEKTSSLAALDQMSKAGDQAVTETKPVVKTVSTPPLDQEQNRYRPERLLNQRLADRFRLDEILDKSGLGAVFKAHDTQLELDVAVKVIDLSQMQQTTDLADTIRQEARLVMRLNHPGVVQVYEFDQTDNLLYIVMEFIPGANLQQVRHSFRTLTKSLLISQVLQLVQQLCLALDYMHQQGTLHPSLMPDNIMLKPGMPGDKLAWQPVLINFALLRPRRETLLSPTEIPVDQLTYQVSPELLLNQPTNERSDVYTLGVILYDLLLGRPPYRPQDLQEATRLHVETPPTPPQTLDPDIPETLQHIILKSLAKDPGGRYVTPGELGRVLEHWAGNTAEAAVQPMVVPPSDIVISMEAHSLTVEPGARITPTATLRNMGEDIDYCQILVQGIPDEWISILPAGVTLQPDELREVKIDIQPPRASASRAGRYTLTIQAISQQGLGQQNELKQILTIAPFIEFESRLWPEMIRSGQAAQVTIENHGNSPETFMIKPRPDQSLIFEPEQAQVRVQSEESQTIDIKVAPRRQPIISGKTSQTFSLLVSPPQGRFETLSGQLISRGLLAPSWVVGLAALIMLLLCAVINLYIFALNPDNVVDPTNTASPIVITSTSEPPTVTPIPTSPTPTLPSSTPGVTPSLPPGQGPNAVIRAPSQAAIDQLVTFDASFSWSVNPIVSYEWQLGDGKRVNAITIDHAYEATGNYNVILTIVDRRGLQATTNQQIRIVDLAPTPTATPLQVPPVAIIQAPSSATEGESIVFDGLRSRPGSSDIERYEWNFGDGTQATGGRVRHAYFVAGFYQVTLTIIDEDLQRSSNRIRIEIKP